MNLIQVHVYVRLFCMGVYVYVYVMYKHVCRRYVYSKLRVCHYRIGYLGKVSRPVGMDVVYQRRSLFWSIFLLALRD